MTHDTEQALTLTNVHINRIFSIRESDHDLALLEAMTDQTLGPYAHLPGVAEALELGIRPYIDPDSVADAVRIHGPGYRGVVYVRDGSIFLIWGGSAAKKGDDGDNPFITYLARLVRTYAPSELYSATFSRFVRALEVQEDLYAALGEVGTEVIAGSMSLDMSDAMGRYMWTMFAMFAAMERDQIVARMALGYVYALKRGRWLLGEAPVPPGYETVEDASGHRQLRLTDDPESIALVRSMIRVLATEGTRRSKVEALAELGLTYPINIPGGTVRKPITATTDLEVLDRLNALLDFYSTGSYSVRRTVELRHLETVAGYPVLTAKDGTRYVEAGLPVERPADGWASARDLEAWSVERARPPKNLGGSERASTKPLSGLLNFTSGDTQYGLLSDGRRGYVLRSRTLDPANPNKGWYDSRGSSQLLAVIDCGTLHQSIAAGIRAALTDGSRIELTDASIAVDDDGAPIVLHVDAATRERHLRMQLKEAGRSLGRATELAVDGESEVLRTAYEAKADEAGREVERLHRQIELLAAGEKVEPERLLVHGRTLLTALDVLANVKAGSTSREFNRAFKTVVNNLIMRVEDGLVVWHLDVLLPTDRGLATLLGVTGAVKQERPRSRHRGMRNRMSASQAVLEALAGGGGHEDAMDAAAAHGVRLNSKTLPVLMAAAEVPTDLRQPMRQHPSADAAQELARAALGFDLPNGDLHEWAHRLRATGGAWHDAKIQAFRTWARTRRTILQELVTLDQPVDVDVLSERLQMDAGQVYRALGFRMTDRSRRHLGPTDDPRRPVLATLVGGCRFAPLTCEHCGSNDHAPVNLPEVVGAVCTGCSRTPAGLHVPRSYLTLHSDTSLSDFLVKQDSASAYIDAIPGQPFTMLEWGDAAGVHSSALTKLRAELMANGALRLLGPDPRHNGQGMHPNLYERA
jgi:hypothetical protein